MLTAVCLTPMDSLVGEGSEAAPDGIPVDILRVIVVAVGNRSTWGGRLGMRRRDMLMESGILEVQQRRQDVAF